MKAHNFRYDSRGFTLVELMVSVAITGIVMIVLSWVYSNTQKIYRSQEAVVDMQQNLRSGLYLISQEIRMAGYDPRDSAGAGILAATSTSINFTQDITDNAGTALDGDGDTNDPSENITLNFQAGRITRDIGGGAQPFLDNVDWLEFNYTVEGMALPTLTPPPGQLDKIRAIQVSILVRSPIQETDLVNTLTYTTGSGFVVQAFPDNFRRRMLITTIQCRNADL
jgi:type IV pilus assembly protein PilW